MGKRAGELCNKYIKNKEIMDWWTAEQKRVKQEYADSFKMGG
jgi:hypothetical protein